jgi:hypothetical protein
MQLCLDFRIFFILSGYSSQDFIVKKELQKALIVFLWWMEMKMGIQCLHKCYKIISSSFEPPYLEENLLLLRLFIFMDRY